MGRKGKGRGLSPICAILVPPLTSSRQAHRPMLLCFFLNGLTAVLSQFSHTEVSHGLYQHRLDACENRWLRRMRNL